VSTVNGTAALLRARGLTVRFEAAAVLSGVDFEVRGGELVTIEGPSGGGKSTLLRALARLQPLTAGSLALDGVEAGTSPSSGWRVQVAYVSQAAVMFPGTVADNVRSGPRLRGLTLDDGTVERLLDDAALPGSGARQASALSGGERQRVALARALANQPRVLLCDEPTSALDPASVERILALLKRCAGVGTAVVVVTHAREQASTLGGTRYRCEGGTLHRDASP
jgi:ABC-type polar amino acid transport system ATPase subunit